MGLATVVTYLRLFVSYGPGLAFILLVHEAIRLQRPDIVDKRNRVRNIETNELLQSYDFIVVGGGSAGAVIASRLSEIESWNVLLLEAGPDESLLSELPFLYPSLQHTNLDWEFRTEPSDKYCLAMDGSCAWPRGKVLGGSSVLNAMMYVRGNRHDYNRWASLGNPGWDYDTMLEYFKKSEDMRDPVLSQSPYHGTNGYLTVEPFHAITAIADISIAAFREIGLINEDNDTNGKTQTGLAQTQGTIRNGLRCSTNKAFLRPARNRPNLHISLNSNVQKVLIDPVTNVAYGVQFQRDNQLFEVHSDRETILCAGSIQSPQLLMLSGVGPANHLNDVGIDVVLDSPDVGENLQDHVAMGGLDYLIKNPISSETLSLIIPKLIMAETIEKFVFEQEGPLYAMGASETMAYISSKYQDPSVDWPDLQLFVASFSDLADGGLFSLRQADISYEFYARVFENYIYHDSYMIIPLLMRPESRGKILLSSDDPMEYPIIHANYFDKEIDINVLIEGAKFGYEISKTSIFQRLTVHGIRNLRVIDASIMPYIVSGNTNAPVIAIAEKGADMIKEDHLNYGGTDY